MVILIICTKMLIREINLNENTRKYHKQQNMAQEQFSEVIGVFISAVSKWKNVQMNPETSMIIKIADFFCVVCRCFAWLSAKIKEPLTWHRISPVM